MSASTGECRAPPLPGNGPIAPATGQWPRRRGLVSAHQRQRGSRRPAGLGLSARQSGVPVCQPAPICWSAPVQGPPHPKGHSMTTITHQHEPRSRPGRPPAAEDTAAIPVSGIVDARGSQAFVRTAGYRRSLAMTIPCPPPTTPAKRAADRRSRRRHRPGGAARDRPAGGPARRPKADGPVGPRPDRRPSTAWILRWPGRARSSTT